MTPEEKLKRCLERHPDWDDIRVAKTAKGATVAMVRAARAGVPFLPIVPAVPVEGSGPSAPAQAIGGFSLRGVRLLSKKPADCMKARLYGLHHGMGYKIEDLSKQWAVSTDTLRKHAKDHNALVYVEASPGEYVACIVHPETPKGD